jgi:hypothetical protein
MSFIVTAHRRYVKAKRAVDAAKQELDHETSALAAYAHKRSLDEDPESQSFKRHVLRMTDVEGTNERVADLERTPEHAWERTSIVRAAGEKSRLCVRHSYPGCLEGADADMGDTYEVCDWNRRVLLCGNCTAVPKNRRVEAERVRPTETVAEVVAREADKYREETIEEAVARARHDDEWRYISVTSSPSHRITCAHDGDDGTAAKRYVLVGHPEVFICQQCYDMLWRQRLDERVKMTLEYARARATAAP